ncbi:MAG TPA: hypothetical protein PK957_03325 [Candidatus Dojkabacteria bacterium]|nr:hypothetical protein [Candidatus Dojkabacteria bacterium]HQF37222.1 hypothetical protein [Candidatus Dojkabacteria bacterium]
MEKVYCIPGHRWQLSFAEMLSVFDTYKVQNNVISANKDFFIVDIDENFIHVLSYLGGIIEYGLIDTIFPNRDEFEKGFDDYIKTNLLQLEDEKLTIAVKTYSTESRRFWRMYRKELGKRIKKIGTANNKKVRYTEGRNDSVAQFIHKIKGKGVQITILSNKQTIFIGKTLEVQDIEGFTIRDRDRPYYSPDVGMLPPKLARIMSNLVLGKQTQIIWDPFCGSGTVLMEALMLGYNLIGTDISVRSVNNTKGNIQWLGEKLEVDLTQPFLLFERRGVSGLHQTYNSIPYNERGTISFVGEPYMGPPIRKNLPLKKIYEIKENVENIIIDLVNKIEYIERQNRGTVQSVVLVIPIYKSRDEWIPLNITKPIRQLNKIGLYPPLWMKEIKKFTEEIELSWMRDNSFIKRKILVLHRNEPSNKDRKK